jgi:SM-20-related protein
MNAPIVADYLFPDKVLSLFDLVTSQRWIFGWKSDPKSDVNSFFHQHYAGHATPDHYGGKSYDCLPELEQNFPLLAETWNAIRASAPLGQRLLRCYANGYPYGCEGTIHTDTKDPNGLTWIVYVNPTWKADWAGETVFFTSDRLACIGVITPHPGRVVRFNGTIPHVARAVSRTCPHMRITLMFKSEPA